VQWEKKRMLLPAGQEDCFIVKVDCK
jgi:hypothetical protein